MNDAKLMTMVDEAVAIDRKIEQLTERLNELKKAFKAEAESRSDEHQDTDGGGWSWEFQGNLGCLVRVTAAAAKLKSKIDSESKSFLKIRDVAGDLVTKLFLPSVAYRPVSNFRNDAVLLLGKAAGRKLIGLVESDSPMSVGFETKKPAAENAA